jgi:hypothetical protein
MPTTLSRRNGNRKKRIGSQPSGSVRLVFGVRSTAVVRDPVEWLISGSVRLVSGIRSTTVVRDPVEWLISGSVRLASGVQSTTVERGPAKRLITNYELRFSAARLRCPIDNGREGSGRVADPARKNSRERRQRPDFCLRDYRWKADEDFGKRNLVG